MPPSPIPAPLPPWAKFVLKVGPFVASFLDALVDFEGPTDDENEWRHCSLHWDYLSAGGTNADDIYVGLDLANITGGVQDASWTDADYDTCEAAITTWITALNSHIPNCYKLVELRWYKRRFNDYSTSKPFADMGPPERVTPMFVTGGSPAPGPTQCAMTVTERTAWPKHWGRMYLPIFGGSDWLSSRRWDPSTCDAVCTATAAMYTTMAEDEFFAIVPVTQVDKTAARGLLGVKEVAVDDVPDVVRRRRLRNVTYRKVLPVAP